MIYYNDNEIRNIMDQKLPVATAFDPIWGSYDLTVWLSKWFYEKFGYKPDRSWDEYYDIVLKNNPVSDFGFDKADARTCLRFVDLLEIHDIEKLRNRVANPDFDSCHKFWEITEKLVADFFHNHIDEMIEHVVLMHKIKHPEDASLNKLSEEESTQPYPEKTFLGVMTAIASGAEPESICGDPCVEDFVQDLFFKEVADRIDYVECCDVKKTWGNDADILLFSPYRFDKEFERAHEKTLKELTTKKEDCLNILAALPKCDLTEDTDVHDESKTYGEQARAILTKTFEDYVWGGVLQKVYTRLGKNCFV